MADQKDPVRLLLLKLENLQKKHDQFSSEIETLQKEVIRLQISGSKQETGQHDIKQDRLAKEAVPHQPRPQQEVQQPLKSESINHEKIPKTKSDFEKFIGENLINKIGIAILVIGVAIGVKYSIEHDLISPLTRIILGYGTGLALLGFGIKLKEKYDKFSAVLVSGAMAIMYVITYAAYSFYSLFPQAVAFVVMVLFTAFTVTAALHYNRQSIAHIALAGAYAVPFLISEGSDNMVVFFSYMAIINAGILTIAVKKYWQPLYVVSFLLTWLIFISWYAPAYRMETHFGMALVFLSIFFMIFYSTFLAHKLYTKKKFNAGDVSLLLANSFIFYGFGYTILNGHSTGEQLLGVFTLVNAGIHFAVGVAMNRQQSADKNLFYFILGLTLVFLTIAIPVQLDGSWVTLLWAGEAALLFWIGRTKNIPIYEKLSYPLMFLAFFSIVHDWITMPGVDPGQHLPLINTYFLASLLFIAAFVFINVLYRNPDYPAPFGTRKRFIPAIISFSIPAILLVAIYYAFRIEIATYMNALYAESTLVIPSGEPGFSGYYGNQDILRFKTVWIINYTLLFLSVLSFVNIKKIQSRPLGFVNLVLNILAILVFLIQGLYTLSELRESYLQQTMAEFYQVGTLNIWVRYISFVFVFLILASCRTYIRSAFMKSNFKIAFDFLLYASVLWIASSELIHWLDVAQSSQTYKLGLSILWGSYALLLIILGIWKKKKHLRIGAIALFGFTLLKLFFYDISQLDTVAKTIVFVSLGILLLIISFLYNKYKPMVSDE